MTQEEVDLIYQYLHEYHEYKDGELIYIKSRSNRKIGDSCGSFMYSGKGLPKIKSSITLNGKYKTFGLAQLIYIYHYKKYFKYLKHIDNNPMNNSITNLLPSTLNEIKLSNSKFSKGYKKIKSNTEYIYKARVFYNKKYINIGSYKNTESANSAYKFAKKLIIDHPELSIEIIQNKIKEKFPDSNLKIKNKYPKGVQKSGNKYCAYFYINKNGKFIQNRIGYYYSPEEAHQAYLKAKKDYENSKTLPTRSS